MRSLWRRFMAWLNEPEETEIHVELKCDASQLTAALNDLYQRLADSQISLTVQERAVLARVPYIGADGEDVPREGAAT